MRLHSINGSRIIWEKTRCHCGAEGYKSSPDNSFNYPYDGQVDTRELEYIEHYQNLAQDLRTLWNMKGVLGTTHIKLRKCYKHGSTYIT